MATEKVVWSRRASEQLKAASEEVAGRAPFLSAPFLDRVLQMVEELSRYPDLGQKIPEYDREGFCQRVFGGHRILLQTGGERLKVLAVLPKD